MNSGSCYEHFAPAPVICSVVERPADVRGAGPLKRGMELSGDWIVSRLLAHEGVEERKSKFADRAALFFEGKEFFHLDEPGLADVRLGRRAVRSMIDELRSDPHVELRGGTSDWIQVHFASRKDAERVLELSELAIRVRA